MESALTCRHTCVAKTTCKMVVGMFKVQRERFLDFQRLGLRGGGLMVWGARDWVAAFFGLGALQLVDMLRDSLS